MTARLGRLTALIPLTLAMAVVGATATAGAEETAPAPCDGPLITDAKGDTEFYDTANLVNPVGSAKPAPPNHDIREAFFLYTPGADGKPRLTANLRVENLDSTELKAEYIRASTFRLNFKNNGGDIHSAAAKLAGGKWTYAFTYQEKPLSGTPSPVGLNRATTVATTGKQYPGPMGVISIDIPIERITAFKPGLKLTDVAAATLADTDSPASGFFVDQAPDTGVKVWTAVECLPEAPTPTPTPEATATPEATPTATPEATPTAAPQQQQQQQQAAPPAQQQPSGGPAPAQTAPRSATPPPAKPKAKKCKKGFKRKTVRGKSKCVKVKKKRR